jgi:hypothetical protein
LATAPVARVPWPACRRNQPPARAPIQRRPRRAGGGAVVAEFALRLADLGIEAGDLPAERAASEAGTRRQAARGALEARRAVCDRASSPLREPRVQAIVRLPQLSWARLRKRMFDIDMQQCPNCGGGELRSIAAILERPVIEKILATGSSPTTLIRQCQVMAVEQPLSSCKCTIGPGPDRSASHESRRPRCCHSSSLRPVFAAQPGRERGHNDSSTQGFNNGTRASL